MCPQVLAPKSAFANIKIAPNQRVGSAWGPKIGQTVPNDRKLKSGIDIVCVLGRELKDWSNPGGKEESDSVFKQRGARVILYQELMENAFKAYKDFLDKSDEAGRVFRLLMDIDESLAA